MSLPYNTKAESQAKINALEVKYINNQVGFRGIIVISDIKTLDGIYNPTEEGTYPNAGNLTYLPTTTDSRKKITFIKEGSTWTKDSVDLTIELQDTPTENSQAALSSGGAFTEFAKKADKETLDTIIVNSVNIFPLYDTFETAASFDRYGFIGLTTGDVIRISEDVSFLREYDISDVRVQDLTNVNQITITTGVRIELLVPEGTDVSKFMLSVNAVLPLEYELPFNINKSLIKNYNENVEPSVDFINKSFVNTATSFDSDFTETNIYNNSGALQTIGGAYRGTGLIPIDLTVLKSIQWSILTGISAPAIAFFDVNETYITGSAITTPNTTTTTGFYTADFIKENYPTAKFFACQKNGGTESFVTYKSYTIPKPTDLVIDSTSSIVTASSITEKPISFSETNTGIFAYANNTYIFPYDVTLNSLLVKGNINGTLTLYACSFGDPALNTELATGISFVIGDNTLDLSASNIVLPANFYLVIKGSASNSFKTWKIAGVPYSLITYDSGNNSMSINENADRVAYSFSYTYNKDVYKFKDFFKGSISSVLSDFRQKTSQLFTVNTPFNSDNYFIRAGRLSLGNEYENLIFINGQSNSDGRAENSTIPANIVDVDGKLEGFMMWNHTTNEFQTYQLGVCTGADNIDGSVFSIYNGFGYDVLFAKKWLTDNPGKKLYAVKTTVGGTGIYNTGRWNPLTGDLVETFQNRLDNALLWASSKGLKFTPMALLYHQGEWDADNGQPGVDAYKQNVSNLFAHFRGYIGASNLPIINGTLSTVYNSSGRYAQINTIFSELNVLDPYFKTVDMSGNQTFVPFETDAFGTIHYDANALNYMAQEMYNYYKVFNLIS